MADLDTLSRQGGRVIKEKLGGLGQPASNLRPVLGCLRLKVGCERSVNSPEGLSETTSRVNAQIGNHMLDWASMSDWPRVTLKWVAGLIYRRRNGDSAPTVRTEVTEESYEC